MWKCPSRDLAKGSPARYTPRKKNDKLRRKYGINFLFMPCFLTGFGCFSMFSTQSSFFSSWCITFVYAICNISPSVYTSVLKFCGVRLLFLIMYKSITLNAYSFVVSILKEKIRIAVYPNQLKIPLILGNHTPIKGITAAPRSAIMKIAIRNLFLDIRNPPFALNTL